jgi:hypothetical protein
VTGKRGLVVPLMALACFTFGRSVDAQTDPAVAACEQAVADGYYYAPDLWQQCLDDYRDSSP